jgi:hypothetical protein
MQIREIRPADRVFDEVWLLKIAWVAWNSLLVMNKRDASVKIFWHGGKG